VLTYPALYIQITSVTVNITGGVLCLGDCIARHTEFLPARVCNVVVWS